MRLPDSFAVATSVPSTAPITSAVAVTANVISVATSSKAPHPFWPKPRSPKLVMSVSRRLRHHDNRDDLRHGRRHRRIF